MTNGAAMGYTIKAMEIEGFEDCMIERVIRRMYYVMDEVDEETAEKAYQNF